MEVGIISPNAVAVFKGPFHLCHLSYLNPMQNKLNQNIWNNHVLSYDKTAPSKLNYSPKGQKMSWPYHCEAHQARAISWKYSVSLEGAPVWRCVHTTSPWEI